MDDTQRTAASEVDIRETPLDRAAGALDAAPNGGAQAPADGPPAVAPGADPQP